MSDIVNIFKFCIKLQSFHLASVIIIMNISTKELLHKMLLIPLIWTVETTGAFNTVSICTIL